MEDVLFWYPRHGYSPVPDLPVHPHQEGKMPPETWEEESSVRRRARCLAAHASLIVDHWFCCRAAHLAEGGKSGRGASTAAKDPEGLYPLSNTLAVFCSLFLFGYGSVTVLLLLIVRILVFVFNGFSCSLVLRLVYPLYVGVCMYVCILHVCLSIISVVDQVRLPILLVVS